MKGITVIVHFFHYDNLELVCDEHSNPHFQLCDDALPMISSYLI